MEQNGRIPQIPGFAILVKLTTRSQTIIDEYNKDLESQKPVKTQLCTNVYMIKAFPPFVKIRQKTDVL